MSATKVYKYGLQPPDQEALVEEQMRAAHRYRNVLVEIERGRRAALRLAEREDPRAAGVAGAISWLSAAAAAEARAIKAQRARTRSRSDTDAMRFRRDEARALVKRAKLALRGYTTFVLRPKLRRATDVVNDRANDLVKSARAHSGVYWGTYLLHERAFDATKKMPLWDGAEPNDPRFVRWRREAAIGVQIQGGMTADELLGEQDRRLRVRQLPPRPRQHGRCATCGARRGQPCRGLRGEAVHAGRCMVGGGKREQHRAELWMRVGSEGREPVWARWEMRMHRPLPKGAIIKGATVHRRLQGRKERWSVDITVDVTNVAARPDSATEGIVGIDVGWRLRPNGEVRVAYWAGSDAEHGELLLGPRDVDEKHDDLRAIRDRHVNTLRTWLLRWRQERRDEMPPWLLEATKTTHAWRAPRRFAALAKRSRHEPTPDEIRLGLEWWLYRDVHLWDWETAQRSRTLRRRRDTYRVFARRLARKYRCVALEHFDLRSMAIKSEDTSDNPVARSNRYRAAISELRSALESAFAEAVHVDAADTTRGCPYCGHAEDWDAEGSLHHTCVSCGLDRDQDHGAAMIIRERGRDAQKAATVRKRKPSKKETKWQRVARLKKEKELRVEAARNQDDDAAE